MPIKQLGVDGGRAGGHIPLISLYRSQDEDDDGVTREALATAGAGPPAGQ